MIRVSMPGNKVKWPFEKKEDVQCTHLGLNIQNGVRKFFVKGVWLCEECRRNFDGVTVVG